MMTDALAFSQMSILGIEELRQLVHRSDRQLVQVDPGRLTGRISHFATKRFALSHGYFSLGVRARGVFSNEQVTIGTSLMETGEGTQWDIKSYAGDIVSCPSCMEHDGTYVGANEFCTISVSAKRLASHFKGEDRLQEEAYWHRMHILRPDPAVAKEIRSRLKRILRLTELSHNGKHDSIADIVTRSTIEAFGLAEICQMPERGNLSSIPAVRIVRRVEEIVRDSDYRIYDVSELCSEMMISRRSLHRAFSDVLGVGPIDFVRKIRLSEVYSKLKESDPRVVRISDIAMQYGFFELGRFAGYYRKVFGEYPIDTLRRRHP